jgi:SpoVK/Ycf46/Vps4 family AAA+-type ATPase
VVDIASRQTSYVSGAITVTPALGNAVLEESWERIVVPPIIKDRLLNHALLSIELRMNGIGGVGLPLHGLVLLSGQPGIGKTTLARGVGSEVAKILGDKYGVVKVVDVNMHVLPSEMLGRTQRNIIQLFEEELPEIAEEGPIIVVLDEIEVLAVSRSQTSLEINPADVFRGTAALLSALDWISGHVANAFVVGTTNLPEMLDDAVLSRTDLRLELPMPSVEVLRDILADTLRELEHHFPAMTQLSISEELRTVVGELEGIDGRQMRKFIVDVLARRRETALNPAELTIDDLLAVARERGRLSPSPGGSAGTR